MKIKIKDQILYQNEDVILLVFITTLHKAADIDIALDQYFDPQENEWMLQDSYRVNNRLYLWYIAV